MFTSRNRKINFRVCVVVRVNVMKMCRVSGFLFFPPFLVVARNIWRNCAFVVVRLRASSSVYTSFLNSVNITIEDTFVCTQRTKATQHNISLFTSLSCFPEWGVMVIERVSERGWGGKKNLLCNSFGCATLNELSLVMMMFTAAMTYVVVDEFSVASRSVTSPIYHISPWRDSFHAIRPKKLKMQKHY